MIRRERKGKQDTFSEKRSIGVYPCQLSPRIETSRLFTSPRATDAHQTYRSACANIPIRYIPVSRIKSSIRRYALFLLRYPRRIAVKRHSVSNRANGTFVQREGGRAGTKPKLYHGSVILGLTLDGESRFCLRSIQFERSELQILTDCPRAYYRTLPARNIGRNCCFRTDSARSDDFGTRSFFFPFFPFFDLVEIPRKYTRNFVDRYRDLKIQSSSKSPV